MRKMTDRELDVKIAEQIFGATNTYWFGAEKVNCAYDGDHRHAVSVPHYSADIAAAWEVIEKMRELGREIEIGNSPHGWYCMFNAPGANIASWTVEDAPTVSRAICLAALQAGEHEVETP